MYATKIVAHLYPYQLSASLRRTLEEKLNQTSPSTFGLGRSKRLSLTESFLGSSKQTQSTTIIMLCSQHGFIAYLQYQHSGCL